MRKHGLHRADRCCLRCHDVAILQVDTSFKRAGANRSQYVSLGPSVGGYARLSTVRTAAKHRSR